MNAGASCFALGTGCAEDKVYHLFSYSTCHTRYPFLGRWGREKKLDAASRSGDLGGR